MGFLKMEFLIISKIFLLGMKEKRLLIGVVDAAVEVMIAYDVGLLNIY